jgi:hypothetical protein
MSFYRHEQRRSQKRRFCEWCGQIIEIGEIYIYEACLYQGDFCTSALHLECRADAEDQMRKDHLHEIEYFRDNERPFIHEGDGI